ncbi:MAG: hypothetical protein HPY44_18760 [Armatimonadetes bacterium]|nr:hypothetical protein [Armatimonadota bacterium]
MSEPVGAFSRKLDTNWRVAMPEPLLDIYPRKLVLCRGFDRSIRIYRTDKWEKFEAELQKLNLNNPKHAKYARFFRSMAQTIQLDTNNRFRFSDPLMQWAGLGENNRNVVIYDAGEYLECWEEEWWIQFSRAEAEEIKELAQEIYGGAPATSHEQGIDPTQAGPGQ